jgi:hypothetical protein
MSDDFTYDPPDSTIYLKGVIALLRSKNEGQIADLLTGSSCEISSSSQYSGRRWNAVHTTINFYVPISKLDSFSEYNRAKILDACDAVMPKTTGYDVTNIEISPLLEEFSAETSLSLDLEEIASELMENHAQILPSDILNKGREMAEVYLYLYCIENSLRLFIESVAQKNYGNDWAIKMKMNRSIKDSISKRKELESRNQWLSIRGNSDLFFIDFKDLGALISLNWDIFKPHFPDLSWIESKIAELAQCRNLVAHNSFVGDHEKELIRLYYRSILKQIGVIK